MDKYVMELIENMNDDSVYTIKSAINSLRLEDKDSIIKSLKEKAISLYNEDKISPITLMQLLNFREGLSDEILFQMSQEDKSHAAIAFILLSERVSKNLPYKLVNKRELDETRMYSKYVKDRFEKDPLIKAKLSLLMRCGYGFSSYTLSNIYGVSGSCNLNINPDNANIYLIAMKLLNINDYRANTLYETVISDFKSDSNELIPYSTIRRLMITSYTFKDIIPEEKVIFDTIIEYIAQKKFNRRYGKAKMNEEFFKGVFSFQIFNEMIDYIETNLKDRLEHPKFISNLETIGLDLL